MTGAPEWYAASLAQEPAIDHLDVDGARIAVRIWGHLDGTPVILIHGGAAHAGWWDHIAPLLYGCRVVAADLSGHGDSAWRDHYLLSSWRDEILALVRSDLLAGPPLVVGHSMGGLVGYVTAASHGDELAGLIMVDSYFAPRGEMDAERARADLPQRVYADLPSILDRFRLVPPASGAPAPYTIDHVARNSVAERADGWSWKFDPRVFAHDDVALEEVRALPACPALVVRGDRGMLSPENAATLARAVDGSPQTVTVADSGHHVLLDQPVALAAVIAAGARAVAVGSHRPAHTSPTGTIGGS